MGYGQAAKTLEIDLIGLRLRRAQSTADPRQRDAAGQQGQANMRPIEAARSRQISRLALTAGSNRLRLRGRFTLNEIARSQLFVLAPANETSYCDQKMSAHADGHDHAGDIGNHPASVANDLQHGNLAAGIAIVMAALIERLAP